MSFDVDIWLDNTIEKLQEKFSQNLLFVGLQGSYNRGEATDSSDIDLVVILDNLTFEDLKNYRLIIDSMPHKEKACGFISGKKELQKWSKADMFQFYYDTKSLYGKLEDIIQPPSLDEIKQSIKISSENLYHATVHSFVHSNNYVEDLQNLYKMTFFILQAKYFVQTNNYIPTKKQLVEQLNETEKEILNIYINKENILNYSQSEIETLYCKLIEWCSSNI
jgi:hypothetical protein